MPVQVEREGATRRARAPKDEDQAVPDELARAESVLAQDGGLFEEIAAPVTKRDLPLINARVVYLGGNPKRSVPFPGRIDVEMFQEGVPVSTEYPHGVKETLVEKVSTDGITSYDFSQRDSLGRLIVARIMPSSSPHAGRVWAAVKHPIHLHNFFRAQMEGGAKEFAVLVEPKYRKAMEEFIYNQERAEKGLTAQIEETIKQ